ncbi:MAG: hypothetical protein LBD29_05805 [Treponema sp.]|nr:hypothetical protein [Treponema sp.]
MSSVANGSLTVSPFSATGSGEWSVLGSRLPKRTPSRICAANTGRRPVLGLAEASLRPLDGGGVYDLS